MSIEYVLAAYGGPRARSCPEAIADPWWYLRQHLAQLERLQHSLDAVTVVVNGWERLPELPVAIRSAPLRIIQRDNLGMSYGAYEHAARVTTCDHLILMEDDYIPTQDGFTEYLLQTAEEKMLVGAVWNWAWRTAGHWGKPTPEQPVAAFFGGIVPTHKLRHALHSGWFGQPCVRAESSYEAGCFNQVALSQAIHQSGCVLSDWLHDYATAYWDGECVRWYARSEEAEKTAFVVPLQAVDKPSVRVRVSEPPQREQDALKVVKRDCLATVRRDGTLA